MKIGAGKTAGAREIKTMKSRLSRNTSGNENRIWRRAQD
jgi:hypothetical protein